MTPGAGWDPREPLRLCTHNCAVVHYENCTGCYGFGVFDSPTMKDVPITASEAMDGPAPINARPCPICRSTIAGVPATPTVATPSPEDRVSR